MDAQRDRVEQALQGYMKDTPQRDDITLLGIRVSEYLQLNYVSKEKGA